MLLNFFLDITRKSSLESLAHTVLALTKKKSADRKARISRAIAFKNSIVNIPQKETYRE